MRYKKIKEVWDVSDSLDEHGWGGFNTSSPQR
jgi:hypothetical protein